ncbi:hypothetical protein [Acinetobacter terrae]|uniref:Uncharacterized protein n=1 Tax=Acinetobacter terrae TaxID=2731247 RepID=A0A8E4GLI7_9GAMM|nr:hypothetical protein [Acinetobacter terrae]NNH38405.1 hypothetical protein [Acinetobacter terrae]
MENFFLELKELNPQDIVELLDKRKSNTSSKKGEIWEITNEIKPIDLFCYLSTKYGDPNGILTLLKSDDSDNLIHWDWMLDSPKGLIHFQGHNFRTEVHVSGEIVESGLNKFDLISQIKSDFKSYGQGISITKKSLEKWTEFINPYYRIKSTIEQSFIKLNELNLNLEQDRMDLKTTQTQLEFEEVKQKWTETLQKYDFAVGQVFGLRAMLPVMAESFVNFLLFILAKPEVKINERLYQTTIRQPIDIRVQSLHLNCNGFSSNVDYTMEECKKFHTLMNERNDLLHGNVNINKQAFGSVYFDKKMPIFDEYEDFWEKSIGVSIRTMNIESIYDEYEVVKNFINYILSKLDIKIRPQIEHLLDTARLGFNEQTKRVGILFPPYLVDMRASFAKGKRAE